jgi:hypothetical protein
VSLPNYEWQERILNGSDEQLLEEIAANRQILEKMEADAAAGRWLENRYLSSSAQALPGWYYEHFLPSANGAAILGVICSGGDAVSTLGAG